jgi:hypothetical protein
MFVVRGKPGTAVTVALDGERIADGRNDKGVVDFNLILRKPGLLRFEQGDASVTFHVVSPESGGELAEKGGYLYTPKGPAVLLARHRFRPKHDRRWETLRVILNLFRDPRPAVDSGILVGAGFIPEEEMTNVDRQSGAREGFWTVSRPGNHSVSEINALITGVGSLKRADIMVLALSDKDLERGINKVQLQIKLEWYLQALRRHAFTHVFVIPPTLTQQQKERFQGVNERLRVPAEGNGAEFVGKTASTKGPVSLEAWMRTVMPQVKRVVRFK